MQGWTVRVDAAAVASNVRVHPAVVDVAVEDFAPAAGAREPDAVPVLHLLAEVDDDDDVGAPSGDPALKREHALDIVRVDEPVAFAAQRRMTPAQVDQLACEAEEIAHRRIGRIETIPE